MRRAILLSISIGLAIVFAGCTTMPLGQTEQAARTKLAADLKIAPEDLKSYSRCVVGRVAGQETWSPRLECIYVQTTRWTAVLDYDQRTSKFVRAFTFDSKTSGVALQSRTSLFGELHQIQVRVKEAVLVVELINADFSELGRGQDLIAAYDYMRQLGIPEMQPLAFISGPPQPRTIYIPIYMPARR